MSSKQLSTLEKLAILRTDRYYRQFELVWYDREIRKRQVELAGIDAAIKERERAVAR